MWTNKWTNTNVGNHSLVSASGVLWLKSNTTDGPKPYKDRASTFLTTHTSLCERGAIHITRFIVKNAKERCHLGYSAARQSKWLEELYVRL